jgi:hypothetical protein
LIFEAVSFDRGVIFSEADERNGPCKLFAKSPPFFAAQAPINELDRNRVRCGSRIRRASPADTGLLRRLARHRFFHARNKRKPAPRLGRPASHGRQLARVFNRFDATKGLQDSRSSAAVHLCARERE